MARAHREQIRAHGAAIGGRGPLPELLIEHDGITDTAEGWARRTGLSSRTIERRYAAGKRGADLLGPRTDPRAAAAVARSATTRAPEQPPTAASTAEPPRAPERRVEAPVVDPVYGACERLISAAARLASAKPDEHSKRDEARRAIERAAEVVARGRDPLWIDVLRAFGLTAEVVAVSFDVDGRAVLLCDVPWAQDAYANITTIARALGHEVVCWAPTARPSRRMVAISVPVDSWEAWCA